VELCEKRQIDVWKPYPAPLSNKTFGTRRLAETLMIRTLAPPPSSSLPTRGPTPLSHDFGGAQGARYASIVYINTYGAS